nr:leucine-rich repeat protein [Eubacterium sp.]
MLIIQSLMQQKFMAMILCLALMLPLPFTDEGLEKAYPYHKSGIYTYQIVNQQEKQITLCNIESTEGRIVIPTELDGYQVYALGDAKEEYEGDIAGEIPNAMEGIRNTVEELIIPSSVKRVYEHAFLDCLKLRNVVLPEGIYLHSGSFVGCSNWDDIVLPVNASFEDNSLPIDINTVEIGCHIHADDLFDGVIQKITITPNSVSTINVAAGWFYVTAKEVIAPVNLKELAFNEVYGDCRAEKVYVNGKNTKVEANRLYNGGQLQGTVTFGEIYTVDKAKAISFAKKEKVTYHVKKIEAVTKVTSKKQKKNFVHKWKKAKTTVTSFQYKEKKKKWKKSTKNAPTVYEVYGKKTKKVKYQLLTTTKKTKWKTTYKYVKVKPVKTW